MEQRNELDRAIGLMGGMANAAQTLGLRSYQVLQQWRKNRVPSDYCPAIEEATNGKVRCESLRPDVKWAVLRKLSPGATASAQEAA